MCSESRLLHSHSRLIKMFLWLFLQAFILGRKSSPSTLNFYNIFQSHFRCNFLACHQFFLGSPSFFSYLICLQKFFFFHCNCFYQLQFSVVGILVWPVVFLVQPFYTHHLYLQDFLFNLQYDLMIEFSMSPFFISIIRSSVNLQS